MMIRGVTISIRLVVMRPMPMLRNRRSSQGILESTGTPYSIRCSLSRLTPPSKHRAAVGDGHRRGDRGRGGLRKLDRRVDRRRTAAQAAAADGRRNLDRGEAVRSC